jgi:hypothetical protein
MNESTFERCEHDRENPYVMISREMAQDKSISPKAKGVLLYLLSLPKDWKIFHSQLQNGLGVGEDYINSAMDELIANGYAERTRERVKGIFQPYKYKIREFKKLIPNRENQPGLTGPVNPALQKREKQSKEEEQQQGAIAPAAVSPKKIKERKPEIYPCLEAIDILKKESLWLTQKYDEETVQHAIAWATSPQTKITTTLVQAIKWACQNRPEMPKDSKDQVAENKAYAMEYDERKNKNGQVIALTKYVEISPRYGQNSVCIEYGISNFKEVFDEFLRKYEFKS